MKRKILAGLLAVTLVLGGAVNTSPLLRELAPAVSASAESYNGFEYVDGGGMIRITGYTGTDTVVTVPAEIDGTPVVAIGNGAFANNRSITRVIIPEGVITIVDSAFEGCTALKSVELPDGLQSIGMWTFLSCISLEEITIPDSVWGLGQYAFDSCTALKKVNIPAKIWDVYPNTFNRCQSLESITVAEGSPVCCAVDGMLYSKDKTELKKAPGGLTEAAVAEGTVTVAADAFRDSPKLSSVTLPDSLTAIGKYALYDCPALKSITVPVTVETIGDNALGFYYDYDTHNIAPVKDFVIFCYKDSAAHKYAVEKGLDFVLLGDLAAKIKVNVRYDKGYDMTKAAVCVENGSGKEEIPASAPGIYLVKALEEGSCTASAELAGFPASTKSFSAAPDTCAEVVLDLYHYGDCNCDGSVNMKDLTMLQRYENGWEENDLQKYTSDIFTDNALNMKDITSLQRFINGWED